MAQTKKPKKRVKGYTRRKPGRKKKTVKVKSYLRKRPRRPE